MRILSPNKPVTKVRGGYNQDALGAVWAFWSTYYKLDIVFCGDSRAEGLSTYNIPYDGCVHRLKCRLQDTFNPADVPGGYGAFRLSRGVVSASYALSGYYSNGTIPTNLRNDTSAPSASMLALGPHATTAKTYRAGCRFNGGASNARQLRSNLSHIEFGYLKNTSGSEYGTFCWDVNVGSAAGTGTGGVASGTPATNSAGAADYTVRAAATCTRTSDNYIQVGGGTAFGVSPYFVYNTHNIAYDGDYTNGYGIRVHNLGSHARTLSDWCNNSGYRMGTIGTFCTNSGSGARFCKLVIVISGANEAAPSSVSPVRTVTQYIADLQAIYDHCIAQPTAPVMMIVTLPMPQGTTDSWNRVGNKPSDFAAAEKQFALDNGLPYLDLHEYCFGTDHQTLDSFANWVNLGWGYASDNTHPSIQGHSFIADAIFDFLTYGKAA